jgi:hypothetical protein
VSVIEMQARALRQATGCSMAMARRLVMRVHEEMGSARRAGQARRRRREWQPGFSDAPLTEADVATGFAEMRRRLGVAA